LKDLIRQRLIGVGRRPGVPALVFVIVVLVMGNLDAWVDAVLHPEHPYFDQEHLIVGGTTAVVSGVLFGGLIIYIRRLGRALQTIKTLETILPICSYCRKILKGGGKPNEMGSWQPIETYVAEQTKSQLSHGICPACMAKLFPELARTRREEGMASPGQGQGSDELKGPTSPSATR